MSHGRLDRDRRRTSSWWGLLVVAAVLVAVAVWIASDDDVPVRDVTERGAIPDPGQDPEVQAQARARLEEASPALVTLLADARYEVIEGEIDQIVPLVLDRANWDEETSVLLDVDVPAGEPGLAVLVENFALVSEDYQTWVGALSAEVEVVDVEAYG